MKSITRRQFLKNSAATGMTGSLLASLGAFGCSNEQAEETATRRPNVLLVMTDDQGFADLACHGNPDIKTPHLDAFAAESTEFTQFHVCAVCSPTRASLMTGRYHLRTGVTDTWMGRSIMRNEEKTVAEYFKEAGYATGIFGKWHLGDNYPFRPSEQGFDEALIHQGGGLRQPSNPPDNGYFDPQLLHNNELKTFPGYCTDIYTDYAIDFMKTKRNQPFFLYHATNAPHVPLEIGDEYIKPYMDAGLTEKLARVYGMVTNFDDNWGRLLKTLEELDIADNTIVIYLTDNGPQIILPEQERRFRAGLRATKGQPYDGGIHVPFYIRWPGKTAPGAKIDRIAAHIDVMPTVLDACGIDFTPENPLDGRSLTPLLENTGSDWADRTIFTQWHRGDEPHRYRCFAARNQQYKLVHRDIGPGGDSDPGYTRDGIMEKIELFDMSADPAEKNNLAGERPEIMNAMLDDYERWFDSVSSRGYEPHRIILGSPHENPVTLTRQDWRGPHANWSNTGLGYWEVNVDKSADFNIGLRFDAMETAGKAHFRYGQVHETLKLTKGAVTCSFDGIALPEGDGRIEAWVERSGKDVGVMYVDVMGI